MLRLAERLYRILLLLYPEAHGREYGPSMLQLFRDLGRDTYRQGGLIGLLRLVARMLVDTAVNAAVENADVLVERSRIMTSQQHARVIVSATMPLMLTLFLSVMNPKYMLLMVAPGSAQPIGWLMTIAVFVLAGAAYVVQRRIFAQSELSAPDPAIDGRMPRLGWSLKRGFALGLSSVFLVLPAVLLVVLGPAYISVRLFLQQ